MICGNSRSYATTDWEPALIQQLILAQILTALWRVFCLAARSLTNRSLVGGADDFKERFRDFQNQDPHDDRELASGETRNQTQSDDIQDLPRR